MKPSDVIILIPVAILIGIGMIGVVMVLLLPASTATEIGHRIFGNAIYNFNRSNSWVPWAISVFVGVALSWLYRRKASKILKEEEDRSYKVKEYMESERFQDEVHEKTRRNIAMQREMQQDGKDGNNLIVQEGPLSFMPEDYPEALRQSTVGRGGSLDPRGYPATLQDALRWKLIQSIMEGEVQIDTLSGKIDSEGLASGNPSIRFGSLTFRVKPKAKAQISPAVVQQANSKEAEQDDIPLAKED